MDSWISQTTHDYFSHLPGGDSKLDVLHILAIQHLSNRNLLLHSLKLSDAYSHLWNEEVSDHKVAKIYLGIRAFTTIFIEHLL